MADKPHLHWDKFPKEQAEGMRQELDALVNTWLDKEWSMESASATLIGYGLHMVKAGKWQSLDELIANIQLAWPLMKVPQNG